MIAFIKGIVFSYTLNTVIIDNQGIGYEIFFAHPDAIRLNQEVMIYTYQHIREDENSLFGFLSIEEKDLFEKLISVKGIGPKTAMGILGAASLDQLINSIEQGEVNALKKMPGIGAKAASQIILDLKGKLVHPENTDKKEILNRELDDAIEALKALGYKPAELSGVIKVLKSEEGKTTDEYVRLGLQHLLKQKGV